MTGERVGRDAVEAQAADPFKNENNKTVLDSAIAYAMSGYAVLPIVPGEKRPLTKNGVHDATTNVKQIREWWSRWPNAGVGIATGKISGVVVIDVDIKTHDGEASLAAWEAEHGTLPITAEVRTPSGGRHLYYRVQRSVGGTSETTTFGEVLLPSVNIGNSVNWLPGVDVRGDGGLVVAPPSVLSNGQYRWLRDG